MLTRRFALIAGIVYLVIGVLGFFPDLRSAPPAHAPHLAVETSYGYLFGLFPVNILHNIVHLAIGLWGVLAYRQLSTSRTFAKGLAALYALLAVMGVLPYLNVTWGIIPLFGHDVWLHALTAAIAAYFGFVHGTDTEEDRMGKGTHTVHG